MHFAKIYKLHPNADYAGKNILLRWQHAHTKRKSKRERKKRSCARFGAHSLSDFFVLPFFIFLALFSDVAFVRNTNGWCHQQVGTCSSSGRGNGIPKSKFFAKTIFEDLRFCLFGTFATFLAKNEHVPVSISTRPEAHLSV